jgi:hypothetical protein
MIITNAIICHIPGIVLVYGSSSSTPGPYAEHFATYEKTQMTLFFLQEVIISGIYLYKVSRLLHAKIGARGRNAQSLMRHLIMVNVLVIVLDTTMLVIEYAEYYHVEVAFKATAYSIKLKMEFSVLNGLKKLFRGRDSDEDQRIRSKNSTQTNTQTSSHTERIVKPYSQRIDSSTSSSNIDIAERL